MAKSTLRFQTRWIAPILDGTKTATARRHRPPVKVGSTAVCQVFDRPFALVHISSCDLVPLSALEPEHRAGVEAIYPGVDPVWLVRFELVAPLGKWLAEARQRADVHESLPAR